MRERYSKLKGRSILLVESKKLLGDMYANCLVTQQMSQVDASTTVPENLTDYMEERNLDSAIVHIASNSEKSAVLDAHKSGKRIVVVRRDPPIDRQDVETYKTFENEGVPMVDKRMGYFERALGTLSQLFEEDK